MSLSVSQDDRAPALKTAIEMLSTAARVLIANGQTTAKTTWTVEQLGKSLGFRAELLVRWEHVILRIDDATGTHYEIFSEAPAGIDMRKVILTMDVVERVRHHQLDATAAISAFNEANRLPPISLVRFALMAGAGAAALGVIFGASDFASLLLIAVSAAAGACLRRWLARTSHNLYVQPLCAALLAGLFGTLAVRWRFETPLHLVAVCPCMILVPGPHLLNGAIDLARGRIALGASRLIYAGMIILMTCAGLLIGLALGGAEIPAVGNAVRVPLVYDFIAAGVAVSAFGTFISMPWRLLPLPIVVGMIAHALRWLVMELAGANIETGALIACAFVGVVMTYATKRLHLPFAGVAFASVVSLMPGVFVFRMAGGVLELVALGAKAPPDLIAQILTDGATAFLIVMAMAAGLIVPKMILEHFPRLSLEPG